MNDSEAFANMTFGELSGTWYGNGEQQYETAVIQIGTRLLVIHATDREPRLLAGYVQGNSVYVSDGAEGTYNRADKTVEWDGSDVIRTWERRIS